MIISGVKPVKRRTYKVERRKDWSWKKIKPIKTSVIGSTEKDQCSKWGNSKSNSRTWKLKKENKYSRGELKW